VSDFCAKRTTQPLYTFDLGPLSGLRDLNTESMRSLGFFIIEVYTFNAW